MESLRKKIIKLAYVSPQLREHLLPLVSDKIAKEFSSEEVLRQYLKEHPKADPKNHWVKKDQRSKSPEPKNEGQTKKKDTPPPDNEKAPATSKDPKGSIKDLSSYSRKTTRVITKVNGLKDSGEGDQAKELAKGHVESFETNVLPVLERLRKGIKDGEYTGKSTGSGSGRHPSTGKPIQISSIENRLKKVENRYKKSLDGDNLVETLLASKALTLELRKCVNKVVKKDKEGRKKDRENKKEEKKKKKEKAEKNKTKKMTPSQRRMYDKEKEIYEPLKAQKEKKKKEYRKKKRDYDKTPWHKKPFKKKPKKEASLRQGLLKLATTIPETRGYILPLLRAEKH